MYMCAGFPCECSCESRATTVARGGLREAQIDGSGESYEPMLSMLEVIAWKVVYTNWVGRGHRKYYFAANWAEEEKKKRAPVTQSCRNSLVRV